MGRGNDCGAGASTPAAARFRSAVGRVQPPDQRVEPEELGVDDQGEIEIEAGLVLLQTSPLLHQLDQVAAVHLHHLVHVDAGQSERHEDLDDELVAGRRGEVGRGAEPLGELDRTVLGDVEALLRALLGGVFGLDEPVALEPLQRRVHLPDVERPHLAGAGLELLAQLQAVLRTLAEQGKNGVADTHEQPLIRSRILEYPTPEERRWQEGSSLLSLCSAALSV